MCSSSLRPDPSPLHHRAGGGSGIQGPRPPSHENQAFQRAMPGAILALQRRQDTRLAHPRKSGIQGRALRPVSSNLRFGVGWIPGSIPLQDDVDPGEGPRDAMCRGFVAQLTLDASRPLRKRIDQRHDDLYRDATLDMQGELCRWQEECLCRFNVFTMLLCRSQPSPFVEPQQRFVHVVSQLRLRRSCRTTFLSENYFSSAVRTVRVERRARRRPDAQ